MTESEPVVVKSKAIRRGAHLFFGTRTDRNPSARNLYSFPAPLLGCGNVASICFKGALWSWGLKLHIYSSKAKPSLGGKELVILSNYTENEIGGAIKCLKWGSEKFHSKKKTQNKNLYAAHAKTTFPLPLLNFAHFSTSNNDRALFSLLNTRLFVSLFLC